MTLEAPAGYPDSGAVQAGRWAPALQSSGGTSLSALGNLQDPSSVIAGAFTYQLTQGTELSLGRYQGIGKSPLIEADSEIRSELGSVGSMYYLALAGFF